MKQHDGVNYAIRLNMARPRTVDTPCVEHTYPRRLSGYGKRKINGRSFQLHRLAYEEHYGPIPPGLCVLHACDNGACINPKHFWLGSVADNNRDMTMKGRQRTARGEESGRAVLANLQVKTIRLAAQLGCRQAWLASHYNVSQPAISRIKTGVHWSHL